MLNKDPHPESSSRPDIAICSCISSDAPAPPRVRFLSHFSPGARTTLFFLSCDPVLSLSPGPELQLPTVAEVPPRTMLSPHSSVPHSTQPSSETCRQQHQQLPSQAPERQQCQLPAWCLNRGCTGDQTTQVPSQPGRAPPTSHPQELLLSFCWLPVPGRRRADRGWGFGRGPPGNFLLITRTSRLWFDRRCLCQHRTETEAVQPQARG